MSLIDKQTISQFAKPFKSTSIVKCEVSSVTVDLINIQFNTSEDNIQIPLDLSVALKPLWYNMKYLYLSFGEKQQIPIVFLRALQCPSGYHSK